MFYPIINLFETERIDSGYARCAAMVTANLDNVKLEAAVLDPDISARGFVLTCSSTVAGPGVELEIGVGDKMYDVSAFFRIVWMFWIELWEIRHERQPTHI